MNGGEADVELLNNGGIQRVEIQQEDLLVIQPDFWGQDETTGVSCLLLGLGGGRLFALLLVIVVLFNGLCDLLGERLVGADVFLAMEFVEQEKFVSFSTSTEQGSSPKKDQHEIQTKRKDCVEINGIGASPKIAGKGCQLLGERQDHQLEHQRHGQDRVALRVLRQLNQLVRARKVVRQPIEINLKESTARVDHETIVLFLFFEFWNEGPLTASWSMFSWVLAKLTRE